MGGDSDQQMIVKYCGISTCAYVHEAAEHVRVHVAYLSMRGACCVLIPTKSFLGHHALLM